MRNSITEMVIQDIDRFLFDQILREPQFNICIMIPITDLYGSKDSEIIQPRRNEQIEE